MPVSGCRIVLRGATSRDLVVADALLDRLRDIAVAICRDGSSDRSSATRVVGIEVDTFFAARRGRAAAARAARSCLAALCGNPVDGARQFH
jgi:hypothetical protein